nr:sigma-70 family RNA polymerase sigma factor [Chryseobacterium phocaeense]
MVFEDIYELYWQKIFRLCMGYVNNAELAQDLAQETFIIVWQQLPKFRNESGIGTWIFRIASNHCLKQIEREKKFTKTELPLNLEEKKTGIHRAADPAALPIYFGAAGNRQDHHFS